MTKGTILFITAFTLLSGCHGDSSPAPVAKLAPAAKAPAAVKRGPTPEELTIGMVEAVTVGVSAVPVAVKFDLPSRPAQGRPLEVVIAVMPQIAAKSAVVQATASEGLQLAPNAAYVEISALDPAQVYRVTIPLTPTAAGVHLLGLNVTLKLDEATESRAFSVPIIVAGASDGAASAAPKTAPPNAPGAAVNAKR